MWSSKLFWKLFVVYAGLNLTLALGFLIAASAWQRQQVLDQVERRLHDTAIVLRSRVEDEFSMENQQALLDLVRELSAGTETRLTFVLVDGEVLADSSEDPDRMENHENRPEIRDALKSKIGYGTSQRTSPTKSVPFYYVALRVGPKDAPLGTVRASMRISDVALRVTAIQRRLWMYAVIVGVLAVALTYLIVGQIIRPMAELTKAAKAVAGGELNYRVPVRTHDEIGQMAGAFRSMQGELASRIDQLQQHGARLSAVLGSMMEGVIAVDQDQRIILANEASGDLLPMVAQSPTGHFLKEVTRIVPLTQSVAEVFDTGKPCEVEFDVPTPNRRTLLVRATPLPGAPCPGAVVVLHDVTELRRLENLRRELVANVSHELKTPLASIKAYAETLRMGAIDDAENNVGFVRRIEEQADRLNQLILDLLSLARVETGREALEIVEVDIQAAVEACLGARQEAIASKNLTVATEPPDEPAKVRADEEGFRTILNNLVDNAVMYTPDGGGITIQWRPVGDRVVLEVKDTGIGVAEEHQQRIFERFYRVDKARSRELGGTGLGLSIIKHLLHAFGGEIGLTSTLGEGSTFEVKLPRA